MFYNQSDYIFQPGYYGTAEIRVKDPAQVELVKNKLTELARKTLMEPGCSIFTFHQDTSIPTRFILWERFDNEDALKKHFEEDHTKEYFELGLTELVQLFHTNVIN
jgi:4-carboxymuconolactone decarboxylase